MQSSVSSGCHPQSLRDSPSGAWGKYSPHPFGRFAPTLIGVAASAAGVKEPSNEGD